MVQQRFFIEKILSVGFETSSFPIKIIKIKKEIQYSEAKGLFL